MSKADTAADGDGEGVVLVPRIRLDVIIIGIGKPCGCEPLGGSGLYYDDSSPPPFNHCMPETISAMASLCKPKVHIPESDIHLQLIRPAVLIGPGRRWQVAKGTLFFRDLSFIQDHDHDHDIEEKLKMGRRFLLQNFSPLSVSDITIRTEHEIWASVPSSEDADHMMSLLPPSLKYSGSKHEPPMILITGVPSQWFVEHPYPSKPSKRLLSIFFETFGKVRDIDTTENKCCTILLQCNNYEDCYNTLKKLCSFSLQKTGNSKMTADYEVSWKDIAVSFSQDKRSCDSSVGQPSKRVCHYPADATGMFEEEFQALMHEKGMLKEQLKVVKTKLKAMKESKGLYI